MLVLFEKYGLILAEDALIRTFEGEILSGDCAVKAYLEHIERTLTSTLQSYKHFYYFNEDKAYVKIKHEENVIKTIYCMHHEDNTERYFGVLSYDGSHYDGFQRQNNAPTIQTAVENILAHLFQTQVTIHASGRTDKGVHSFMQPFHFDANNKIPLKKLYEVINHMLPSDIALKSLTVVPPIFHARYDTVKKTYLYKIDRSDNPFNAHYQAKIKNIDLKQLKTNLECFIGQHDFSNFAKSIDKDNVRTIYDIVLSEDKESIHIEITGNGFLRYMIRMMIGAALNHKKATIIKGLNKPSVPIAKHVAIPNGLYLKSVEY